jgi:hypothetical protein
MQLPVAIVEIEISFVASELSQREYEDMSPVLLKVKYFSRHETHEILWAMPILAGKSKLFEYDSSLEVACIG